MSERNSGMCYATHAIVYVAAETALNIYLSHKEEIDAQGLSIPEFLAGLGRKAIDDIQEASPNYDIENLPSASTMHDLLEAHGIPCTRTFDSGDFEKYHSLLVMVNGFGKLLTQNRELAPPSARRDVETAINIAAGVASSIEGEMEEAGIEPFPIDAYLEIGKRIPELFSK